MLWCYFADLLKSRADKRAGCRPSLTNIQTQHVHTHLLYVFAHRYDDMRSAQDNIDLQSTILSRFDLIFIVKDPASESRDAQIATKARYTDI